MKRFFIHLATPGNLLAVASFWFSVWLYRALICCVLGSLIGLCVAPVTKLLFFEHLSWATVMRGGAITGFQYAGLWSSAISLAWVVMDRRAILAHARRFLLLERAEPR
ncbi:MAG: hypothetical protein ABQ298_04950 [Puniceicoccaceae bacterium]